MSPLLDDVLARPGTLGRGRLVCVDGPAGAGKTTLGESLVRAAAGAGLDAALLHMDDLFEGWAGLEAGRRTMVSSVVAPLRTGEPGRYRRFDWHAMAYAEQHVVAPCDLLVVEGVGSSHPSYDDVTTLLVWVEAPADVRLERGLLRDGEQMREHWLTWRVEEDALFARERTRERADVVVDGTR